MKLPSLLREVEERISTAILQVHSWNQIVLEGD